MDECQELGSYVQSRGGQQHVCGLGHVCRVEAVVIGHVGVVVVFQSHHIGDEGVSRDTERLQQIPFLDPTHKTQIGSNGTPGSERRRYGASRFRDPFEGSRHDKMVKETFPTHLEDGKHHAAERPVIGELSHMKDIKAPLIQVIQLLQNRDRKSVV